jgi:lysozyme
MSLPNNKGKLIGGSAAGIAAAIALIVPVIQQWEGHEPRPYKDVVGVLTVCYGHTGPDIRVRDVYTPKECKDLLESDIEKFAIGVVEISPELIDKPYILASTISFSYNIGLGAYKKSSVARNFKAGNYAAGCGWMLKYVYAGGKKWKGLENRRKAEYKICMKGVDDVGKST